ncbi:hypothetical protein U3A55_02435 [Salarchaeum sp. III]|uniref:hypothetical protein n=1 Tax=Salarchaeum sp. III TaxID=3107927 RepID=UPI002ED9CCFE
MNFLSIAILPLLGAGILGDLFGKVFSFFGDMFSWLGKQLRNLFQGLIDIIVGFFEVIYALIDSILYFIYNIGLIAVKLFQLIFEVLKLLWSLFEGLGRTIQSLTYTPQTSANNGYSEMIGKIFQVLEPLQINVVAYILLFGIWIGTAVSAIKLLSSIRVGGS